MIPYLLAIAGGYLLGNATKENVKFADGGMMAKGGLTANGKRVFNEMKRKEVDRYFVSPTIVGYYAEDMRLKLSEKEMQDVSDLYISTSGVGRNSVYSEGGEMTDGYLYAYDCYIKGIGQSYIIEVWSDNVSDAKDICEGIIGKGEKIKNIKKTKIKTSKDGVDLDNIQWKKNWFDFTKTYSYKLLVDGYDGLHVSVDFRYAIGSGWEIRYNILGKSVSDYSFDTLEEAKEFAIKVLKSQLEDKSNKSKLVKQIKDWKNRIYGKEMADGGMMKYGGEIERGDVVRVTKPNHQSTNDMFTFLSWGDDKKSFKGKQFPNRYGNSRIITISEIEEKDVEFVPKSEIKKMAKFNVDLQKKFPYHHLPIPMMAKGGGVDEMTAWKLPVTYGENKRIIHGDPIILKKGTEKELIKWLDKEKYVKNNRDIFDGRSGVKIFPSSTSFEQVKNYRDYYYDIN